MRARGRREPEEAPRRYDEPLGTAREPRQGAEGECDEPAQQPRPDRDANRIEAANCEADHEARCRRPERTDQGADFRRGARVPKEMRGRESANSDERALGEGGDAAQTDGEGEARGCERRVGAARERVVREDAGERERRKGRHDGEGGPGGSEPCPRAPRLDGRIPQRARRPLEGAPDCRHSAASCRRSGRIESRAIASAIGTSSR
jgi:hypothetical protein